MRTPPNERVSPDIANIHAARGVSGPDETRPERRCILSGEGGERDLLLRLAISPDGLVLPDPMAKAPGRGAWLGVSRPELEAAIAKGKLKGALARAFKGASLTIPEELPAMISASLQKAMLDRLGLALRSGALVLGAERIAEHARAGRLAALFHAQDASEDGRKKLDQAWRVGLDIEGSGERGIILPLDRHALSVALGRDNVVHFGVSALPSHMGAANKISQMADRLRHFGQTSGQAGQNTGTAPDNEFEL